MDPTFPSLKALILGLFSIVELASGTKNNQARDFVASEALTDWFPTIPELAEATTSAISGNGTDLSDLGEGLKRFIVGYKKEQKQNMTVLAGLIAFKAYFLTGDLKAWSSLESLSHNSSIPTWVGKMFLHEVEPQRNIKRTLESVVKQMTGLRQSTIPTEDAEKLKKKFPDLYAEYLTLRRGFNKNWKEALSQFVINSGKKRVDFQEVEDYFNTNEIETTWPTGFVGRIDGAGNIFTKKDEKIAGGLPTKSFFPAVRMNTSGDGDWVFQAYGLDGQLTSRYSYTENYNKETVKHKFEVVDILTTKIDQIQAKWRVGLKKFDEHDPITVACLMLELLYTFSARIGSLGNAADGEETFGLGTLLRKHIRITDNSFVISYKGKDGVATRHALKATEVWSKLIVKAMNILCEGKKPNEFLFTSIASNGTRKRVPSTFVNRLFKTYGAGDATVHKLRTLRATRIFTEAAEELSKKGKKLTNPKDVMDAFKKIATECGKALNHIRTGTDGSTKVTPMTAIQSYIDVSAQIKFFQSYGVPLPGFLQKRAKKMELGSAVDLDEEEDFITDEEISCLL